MTLVQAIYTCMFTKLFTVSGRARRAEFWWLMLAALIFHLCGSVLLLIPLAGALVYATLSVWLGVANLTATVRRLHDVNKRGWWLMLPLGGALVACSAAVIMLSRYPGNYNAAMGIVSMACFFVLALYVVLLVLCLSKGTDGPNRFGPDPLQAEHSPYLTPQGGYDLTATHRKFYPEAEPGTYVPPQSKH